MRQLLIDECEIDRSSATPVFRQVANCIEQAARKGAIQSQVRLPSEDLLATKFVVNRATVRRAIKVLVDSGLALQVQGRGTFLIEQRIIEQPLASSLISFSNALKNVGIAFTTEVISSRLARPSERISRRLATNGEVYLVRRLRRVEGTPVILLDNFMPVSMFPGLMTYDLGNNQLFKILAEQYDVVPSQGTRTFEAMSADLATATLLAITVGAPVMYAEQTTRAADGTIVEASDMWFPGRRFRLFAHLFEKVNDDAAHYRGR